MRLARGGGRVPRAISEVRPERANTLTGRTWRRAWLPACASPHAASVHCRLGPPLLPVGRASEAVTSESADERMSQSLTASHGGLKQGVGRGYLVSSKHF